MRPIQADFGRGSRPSRWMWWNVALMLAIAAGAAGAAWRQWHDVREAEDRLRRLLAEQRAQPAIARVPRPAPPYEASARELLGERRLPWTQALTALEATAVVGVTPVAVELSAPERSVRVEVAFSDYRKLLEYLDQLNADEPELRWTLLRTQALPDGKGTAVLVASSASR